MIVMIWGHVRMLFCTIWLEWDWQYGEWFLTTERESLLFAVLTAVMHLRLCPYLVLNLSITPSGDEQGLTVGANAA